MIEYGLKRAKELNYKGVLVEGNPRNYNPRGFKTSLNYGISAKDSVGLPVVECLMALELVEGGLADVKGAIDYNEYEALR